MTHEGPQLERLLRRIAECPADVLPAAAESEPQPALAAVVGDLLRDLGAADVEAAALRAFAAGAGSGNRARLVLVACWLLHDEWFVGERRFWRGAQEFLANGLTRLAGLVQAERFVADPDRREELARSALAALGLRPQGETPEQARDRLTTLDSVERAAVLEATRAAEERARQVREAMARAAAQEAAASWGRE